jgi:chloramphenicol 3-O phosphotransferase
MTGSNGRPPRYLAGRKLERLLAALRDQEAPSAAWASAHLDLTSLGFESEEHLRLWWTVLRSELCVPVLLGIRDGCGRAAARLRAASGAEWSAEAHIGSGRRIIALRIGPSERAQLPGVRVIQLNGISSSGKTSVARALQVILPGIWLHFQPDVLALMLPKRPRTESEWRQFDRGVLSSAQALLTSGNRLIIDHALLDPKEAGIWQNRLSSSQMLRVTLHCAGPVARAREQRRGNRRPGLSREQAPLGGAALTCDLLVDTTSVTPLAAARVIKRHLQGALARSSPSADFTDDEDDTHGRGTRA